MRFETTTTEIVGVKIGCLIFTAQELMFAIPFILMFFRGLVTTLLNLKIGRYCIELIMWQRMAEPRLPLAKEKMVRGMEWNAGVYVT